MNLAEEKSIDLCFPLGECGDKLINDYIILKMRKLVISYPILPLNRSILLNYVARNITRHKDYFERNNLHVIDLASFCEDRELKPHLKDYHQDFKTGFGKILDKAVIKSGTKQAQQNLTKHVLQHKTEYKNAIFLGIQPIGFDFFFSASYKLFKSLDIKFIIWQDDLQAFPIFRAFKELEGNIPDAIEEPHDCDHRLEKADLILSPSKLFFENVKSKYVDKTCFFFYPVAEELLNKYEKDFPPFQERKKKLNIIGCSNRRYPFRYECSYLLAPKYPDIIENSVPLQATGLDYLDLLAQNKGCLYGSAIFPLNFPLSKVVEILMVGTVGVFQEDPVLNEVLGLIPYEHYIPIKYDDDPCSREIRKPRLTLKFEEDGFYRLNGVKIDFPETIAKAGKNYILEKCSGKNQIDHLIELIKQLL